MANAGTVNIKLVAQTAAFEAGMKKVDSLLGGLSGSLKLVQGVAAGFLTWKATGFVREQMAAIDSTAKLADRLGLTTEAMVGLQHAGDLAGVSAETVATSVEKMGKNLADVGKPAAAVTEALDKMGLSLAEMRTLSPGQQLGKIADGLDSVAGAGERTAVATALFGNAGAAMLPMLADGSEGLAAMQKEADALGLSFSRIDAFKVEQANDAMSRVGALFTGAFRTAAIEVSPYIESISKWLLRAAENAGGFGKIVLSVFDHMRTAMGVVGDAWNVLSAGWHAGKAAIYTVAEAWARASDAGAHAIQYVGGMWNNWVQLVQDSTSLLVSTFGWLWAKAKEPIAAFVEYSGQQLSALLHQAAAATSRLKGGMSQELTEAAYAIGRTTNTVALNATKDAETAAGAMKSAGDEVRASWSNLFNVQTSGSPIMQQLAEGFRKSGEDSAYSFTQSFAAVLGQDASATISDWFAQIEAMSQASAAASAERVAARLEVDRAGGEQQVAESEARESYLTEMFGKQADKKLAWDKQTLDQRLSYTSNILGNLATLQNTSSRKMFEVGKAAAYANAVVTTAAGIARQFADLPIYAAIPAAAAVAVAGAVQIANIASTSFGGGGSVSSSGGSIPLVNGEPAGTQMVHQGAVQPNTQTLRVSIDGLSDDALLSGRQVRRLIEQINEQQSDGSTLEVSAA